MKNDNVTKLVFDNLTSTTRCIDWKIFRRNDAAETFVATLIAVHKPTLVDAN
ncbi:MAG: hypothetical protein IPO38_15330 [Rhodocyclaceae bacterium]|nr:hypothetical protein [Rhodocyclaceae bacterium]MBL0074545.1 hypothetical protein [Rhodocyclaceae bacterium]